MRYPEDLDISAMDAGQRTLEFIHQRLMIDEAWTIRRERGFSWIANALQQDFTATAPIESRGLNVCLVHVRTRVVEATRVPATLCTRGLVIRNTWATGSAYLHAGGDSAIDLVMAHPVHDDTVEFRGAQLADFAILQLIEGEQQADKLAEGARGAEAHRRHPVSGYRPAPDDMLTAVADVFAPAGEGESRFADDASMQGVSSIEVPFGPSDTTQIELSTTWRHPVLGGGLAVRTTLPRSDDFETSASLAAKLQREQLGTVEGGGQIGAWCVRFDRGSPRVAWTRFLPNATFQPGLATDVAMGEISRAIWADSIL